MASHNSEAFHTVLRAVDFAWQSKVASDKAGSHLGLIEGRAAHGAERALLFDFFLFSIGARCSNQTK